MRGEDIPFAIRLSNQEKWGITRSDFTRILKLDSEGSFVAIYGSRRVGLLTTTSYGRKLAWIGNVIVDREHRGKHIGQALVQNAVGRLQRTRVRHIALYCFDENVSFYRGLGFVRDAPFVRLQRKPKHYHQTSSRGLTGRRLSLSALFSVDRIAFGADRSKLLHMVLKTRAGWYLGFSSNASTGSYILVKQYKEMSEFGPWVCVRPQRDEPRQILHLVLSKTCSRPIEVSCLSKHKKALPALLENGFEMLRHGYRMYYQSVPRMGNDEANYALGFLDKG